MGDAGSCGQGDRCSSPAPSFGLCIFWQLLSLWVSASSAFLFNCGWPRPLSVCCGSLSQAMHVISPSSFMWPGCPPTDADLLMRPDVFVRHFWGALLSGFSGPQLLASRVWGQLSPHPGICWWPLSRSLRRWRPAGSCRFLQTGPGPSSHPLGARAGSPPSLCAVLRCWLSRPGAQLDLNLTCDQKPLLSFPSFCAPVRAGVQRVDNRNTRVSLLNLTLLFVDSSQGTISGNTEMGFLSLFLLMS